MVWSMDQSLPEGSLNVSPDIKQNKTWYIICLKPLSHDENEEIASLKNQMNGHHLQKISQCFVCWLFLYKVRCGLRHLKFYHKYRTRTSHKRLKWHQLGSIPCVKLPLPVIDPLPLFSPLPPSLFSTGILLPLIRYTETSCHLHYFAPKMKRV